MRQDTLRSVALETLSTATQAAEHTVAAYRSGGHRLLAVIEKRLTAPTAQRAERFAPRLAAALRRSSARTQGLVTRGIDLVSDRTGAVIDATAQGVRGQVQRVSRMAKAIDSPILSKGIDAAVRLSLPGAKAALALTERVAAIAGKLPVARRSAKPAKAAKATRGSKRAGSRMGVAEAAQADAAVAVRRTRKAVGKAVDKAQADLTPAKAARRRVVKAPVQVVVQA